MASSLTDILHSYLAAAMTENIISHPSHLNRKKKMCVFPFETCFMNRSQHLLAFQPTDIFVLTQHWSNMICKVLLTFG